MDLIKYILFHNFWSFLLILSGIIDIVIGIVLYFGAWLSDDISSLNILFICFAVGMVYLLSGVVIAVMQKRKRDH